MRTISVCGFAFLALGVPLALQTAAQNAPVDETCRVCPHVGDAYPELTGLDLQGNPHTVRYASRKLPTAIYNFSSGRPYNYPEYEKNLSAVIAESHDRFQFVLVDAHGDAQENVKEYVRTFQPTWNGASVDVLTNIPTSLAQRLTLQIAPRIDIISPEGRVLHTFSGPFGLTRYQPVLSIFGVKVPYPVDK